MTVHALNLFDIANRDDPTFADLHEHRDNQVVVPRLASVQPVGRSAATA